MQQPEPLCDVGRCRQKDAPEIVNKLLKSVAFSQQQTFHLQLSGRTPPLGDTNLFLTNRSTVSLRPMSRRYVRRQSWTDRILGFINIYDHFLYLTTELDSYDVDPQAVGFPIAALLNVLCFLTAANSTGPGWSDTSDVLMVPDGRGGYTVPGSNKLGVFVRFSFSSQPPRVCLERSALLTDTVLLCFMVLLCLEYCKCFGLLWWTEEVQVL